MNRDRARTCVARTALAAAGLLASGSALAQLIPQTPEPTGVNLGGAAFVSPTHGFIVGQNHTLIETFDAGQTWITRMNTGFSSDPFYTITFPDALHGYVAGNNQDAYRTVDGGVNWTPMPAMQPGSVRVLDFITPTTGFAGYNGALTWTPNGGGAWDLRSWYPDAPIVFGMDFRDENVGLACGIRSTPHHDGGIFRTDDGGRTWTLVEPNIGSDVLWLSDTTAMAVSGDDVWRSDDTGLTWYQSVYDEIYTGLIDVARVGNSDVLAGVSAKGDIWFGGSLGAWWSRVVPGIGVLPADWSVSFFDELNGWVVGANGLTYRTTDSGYSWQLMNSGCGDEVMDIDFAADENLGVAVTHRGFVFTTRNRGQDWAVRRLQVTGIVFGREEGLRTVQVVRPDFVIAGGAGGILFRTQEDADGWINVSDPNLWGGNFEIRDIHMADPNNGWLGGFYGVASVYRTYNGGYTWVEVPAVGGSIVAVDQEGQRVWAATGGSVVWRSPDFGQTWADIAVPGDFYYITDMEFVDEQIGWVAGFYGSIAKSIDGGDSWIKVDAPQNETYLSLEMNGPSEILLVGYDNNTYRYFYKRSTNGGANWTRTELNQFQEAFSSSHLRPSGRFWLGGSVGKIVYQPAPPLQLSLPNVLPEQVPPSETYRFAVRILDGEEALVPGSPTLWVRRSAAGAFQALPLEHVAGADYLAPLPPFSCNDTPQFYVSAGGDGGTTVRLPAGAPDAFYSLDVGVFGNAELLACDFEAGLPAGWSTTGLWHTTSTACLPAGACGAGTWAYFGQDATCTFNTGARAAGTLRSPLVTLPVLQEGQDITLTFCSALDTEYPNNAYGDDDQAMIWFVSGANSWWVHHFPDHRLAREQSVSFNYLAGRTGFVEWRFDTQNTYMNDYRGWHVDNIRLTAPLLTCDDGVLPGDSDGDGDVDLTDLATLLIAFGTCSGDTAFNPAADFDASDCVNLVDLALLLTNFGT